MIAQFLKRLKKGLTEIGRMKIDELITKAQIVDRLALTASRPEFSNTSFKFV
jgi:hypothetical protein